MQAYFVVKAYVWSEFHRLWPKLAYIFPYNSKLRRPITPPVGEIGDTLLGEVAVVQGYLTSKNEGNSLNRVATIHSLPKLGHTGNVGPHGSLVRIAINANWRTCFFWKHVCLCQIYRDCEKSAINFPYNTADGECSATGSSFRRSDYCQYYCRFILLDKVLLGLLKPTELATLITI